MFRAAVGPSSGETTVFYYTWYLLFCVDDCLVCRSICFCIPDSHPHRITSTMSHKQGCFSWWWAHSRPKHVEIDKYNKNKFVHQFGFIYKTIGPIFWTFEVGTDKLYRNVCKETTNQRCAKFQVSRFQWDNVVNVIPIPSCKPPLILVTF